MSILFANEKLVPGSYPKAREGLNMIRPFELSKGMVIYRFYDTKRAPTPQSAANGAWWMEFEYFQKIRHFADRHSYPPSYAARLFAAILYEWSEVNAYVACELLQPLKAWKGRGKQVESSKNPYGRPKDPRDLARMTPMQSELEIYQLCIPGVYGPNSIGPAVLKVLRSSTI